MSKFDEINNRKGSGSAKWDALNFLYGKDELIPMWVADMDFKTAPSVIDALVKRAQHGIFGYGLPGSFYSQTPISWHERRNKISYDREHLFFSDSVLTSLNIIIRALTKENDNILLLTPSYGPLKKIPENARRTIIECPMVDSEHGYQINFDTFEKSIRLNQVKMFILCNPQNPTGRVWTVEELTKMVEICKKYQVTIVSDEIHSDLIMPNQLFTPILKIARSLSYEQQTIMMCAPTKTFNLAGLHISYYVCSNPIFNEKINQVKAYSKTLELLSDFGYVAMEAAYKDGDDYVDELREYIFNNYQFLIDRLKQEVPKVKYHELEATYLVWIDVSAYASSEERLKEAMLANGVVVETSSEFFEKNKQYIRINIACPRKILNDGTDAIIQALQQLERRG